MKTLKNNDMKLKIDVNQKFKDVAKCLTKQILDSDYMLKDCQYSYQLFNFMQPDYGIQKTNYNNYTCFYLYTDFGYYEFKSVHNNNQFKRISFVSFNTSIDIPYYKWDYENNILVETFKRKDVVFTENRELCISKFNVKDLYFEIYGESLEEQLYVRLKSPFYRMLIEVNNAPVEEIRNITDINKAEDIIDNYVRKNYSNKVNEFLKQY